MSINVICPRCQKTFNVPPERGDVWRSCPYCSEVNPAALVRKQPEFNAASCLGVLLLLAGVLGGTLGTFLCYVVRDLSNPELRNQPHVLALIWALCSVALFGVGVRLMLARKQPKIAVSIWGPGGVFLVILLLGICGWIFVFGTCIQQ